MFKKILLSPFYLCKYIFLFYVYILKYTFIFFKKLCYYIFVLPVKLLHNIKYSYTNVEQFNGMDGHEFEYACADILRKNGFDNVEVTRGSGDFGVDIIARKGNLNYAIQCKCYNHKLNNAPIQEVVAGMSAYNCNAAAVMTNQYFTEPAKELARINNVELWDADVLSQMMSKNRYVKNYKQSSNANQRETQPITKVKVQDIQTKEDNYNKHETPENDHSKKTIANNQQKSLTDEQIQIINYLDDFEENNKLYKQHLTQICEYTINFFAINTILITVANIDIDYENYEEILEIKMLDNKTRTSQIKKSTHDLALHLGVEYVKYVFPTSTKGTIGLKMPLPSFMHEQIKLLNKYQKDNQIQNQT